MAANTPGQGFANPATQLGALNPLAAFAAANPVAALAFANPMLGMFNPATNPNAALLAFNPFAAPNLAPSSTQAPATSPFGFPFPFWGI
ncbi:MAG: hypothetical protein JWN15_4005 [Firmicutes bacterium]|nr:hypothetical protein [Bacillota bacterium]